MSLLNPYGRSPTYPDRPGHVHGSHTSREAADAIRPMQGELHERVLVLFRQAGERGLTDNELQAAGNTDSVLRPRRIELTHAGRIKSSGRTRLTESNRKAEVWVLV